MLQLKDLLRRKGMTAKELAVKIGISEGALSKSLSGNPTLERIEQIAAALYRFPSFSPLNQQTQSPARNAGRCWR